MGYRLKYRNLKIKGYSRTPSGRKLKNKYAIVEGNTLVSAAQGLSKRDAKRIIKVYRKQRVFKFTG